MFCKVFLWSIGESNPCSATSIVATPHWGDCSFSVDLTSDEISATGGRQRFALSNASHCLRAGGSTSPRRTKKYGRALSPANVLWSIGESNPVSLRCACSVRFAIVIRLLCRSADSFAHQASTSLSPSASSPLGCRSVPPLSNASPCRDRGRLPLAHINENHHP